ncbi:conserved hypothetical protein, partial [Ricinus communis]
MPPPAPVLRRVPRSEGRDHRRAISALDERPRLRAVQRRDQLLHARIALRALKAHDEVHIGAVLALDRQRVPPRIQLGVERIVGVDQRQIDLIEHARQRRRLELAELQVLAVLDDVLGRGGGALGVEQ